MKILVRAPSNIALVKYMGKKTVPVGAQTNLPENPSLSLTLSSLCTFLELRISAARAGEESAFRLLPEMPGDSRGEVPKLTPLGGEKFLKHLRRCEALLPSILDRNGIPAFSHFNGDLEVRSSNTFPQSAGIASSASSFAALTLAAGTALVKEPIDFSKRWKEDSKLRGDFARVSREGSGSSCRSFHGPFVAWEGANVSEIPSNLPPLSDLVIIVSSGEKKVGSTEAHSRVKTSPSWPGRVARASERFEGVRSAIIHGNWESVIQLAGVDSRDMHELFSSAEPPFSYFEKGTESVLDFLKREHRDARVAVTLDAGPNIHLIVPQSEEQYWKRVISDRFPEFPCLIDREGQGAEVLKILP
ncbi:MAG: hypothetical protein H7301_08255 [Cryobacterium sp.]|nr:hypothetical protein [Oligoflexia bacterium]